MRASVRPVHAVAGANHDTVKLPREPYEIR